MTLQEPSSTTYPWKLRPEEIPTPTFSTGWEQPKVFHWPLLWPILTALTGLVLLAVWLILQYYWIDPNYRFSIPEASLNTFQAPSISVVPSPIRYHLLSDKASISDEPIPPTVISESKTSSLTALSSLPVDTSVIPPVTAPVSPPPVIGPSFQLIGIAHGSDGTVATIKITGDTDEMKDVREGEMLMPGYQVAQIEPEYVLLKQKGKTLRVD